jgi:hypothetical protein
MLFVQQPMATASRSVGVTVSIVVVPDRADVAGIGFEEQFRHGENAVADRFANRAVREFGRLSHGPLYLEIRAAIRAREIVFGQRGIPKRM